MKSQYKNKIKFSNTEIEKFKPNFGNNSHLEIPFDVSKNSYLNGLALKLSKRSKTKYFVFNFWNNNRKKQCTLGIYKKNKYGTEQIKYEICDLYQLKKTYQSTIALEKILSKNKLLSGRCKRVLDVGCGTGVHLQYFAKRYKNIKFFGTDYSNKLIRLSKTVNKYSNLNFFTSNVLNFKKKEGMSYDGIICIHTLCCFKNLYKPLKFMCDLKPKWIAIKSLFYNWPLDVLIHFREHKLPLIKDDNPDADANIFSIEYTSKIFNKLGYKLYKTIPFYPKKKILKPKEPSKASYTMKTEINKFTTFTGPVHFPWHFIIAKRLKKK